MKQIFIGWFTLIIGLTFLLTGRCSMKKSQQEVFDNLLKTIDAYSIEKHNHKNAIFALDSQDKEIIGIHIIAVEENHPDKGNQSDWVEFLDRQKDVYSNFQQPFEYLSKAYFCWAKKDNEIAFILLSSHNYNVHPAVNGKADLDWSIDQLNFFWQKAFPNTKLPKVIVFNPEEKVSIYDHYLNFLKSR